MSGRTVHLRVGGQTYRVTTSSSDEELQRLAAIVDQKLATVVPPGRAVTPQAMLLAAMALAYDLEEERVRAETIAARARGAFGRMLERVDAALDATEGTVVVEAATTPAAILAAAPSSLPGTATAAASTPAVVLAGRASLPLVAASREARGSSPPAANESRFAPKPSSDP